jgi:hypothetical protein
MALHGMYFGIIEEVYPPNHQMNASKLQYEYRALITIDGQAQLPVKCIKLDPYGSIHNYEDSVLTKGCRVFVQFPRGDKSLGVIMGGSRFNNTGTDSKAGIIYEHRFNEIIETNDFKGSWMLRSTSGPFIKLEKTRISITDTPIKQDGIQNANYQATNDAAQSITTDPFNGQFIVLDKAKGELFINTNELKIIVNQNADVHIRKDSKVVIDGAATINITKDATVNVQGNTNLNVAQNVVAKVKGDLKADIGGQATVKAKEIMLKSDGAGFPLSSLISTMSSPLVDMITGLPAEGLDTIQGGS